MDWMDWIKGLATRVPTEGASWSQVRFITRARTLFYARLAFLAIGLSILAIPRWAHSFGAEGTTAFVWYFIMILYSAGCYMIAERGFAGKAATFLTLCIDLLVLVYMIAFSGGLKSPVLPTQVVYTIFFALLFPNPLSIIPPLLTLPVVAKIDTEIPGRVLQLEDIFLLVWYSAVNFIVVYVIVYLNERDESQHEEIIELQKDLQQMAVVEERNRLSREIHDGLGASLSSLIIQSEYLFNLATDPDMKFEIRELKDVAEESIDELRRSISMMRDDFDLVPALDDYCQNFSHRAGIRVDYKVVGKVPKLDGELQLAVFRVLQESLTNIRKHAKASAVKVDFSCNDDVLVLSVKDDGVGFDYKGDLQGHYGLGNMSERARKYGGSLEISSFSGQGCQIMFQVPLSPGKTEGESFIPKIDRAGRSS